MKPLFKFVMFLLVLLAFACNDSNESDSQVQYTDFVNPLMGADSHFSLSNGNTYPAIAVPWGMNFWTPMTADFGDGWTYNYRDHLIKGFKQTHQPSPWINDYAAFALMAVTGDLKFKESERASWFSHKAEEVSPHYYSVYLADYDTKVEVAPTSRAAAFHFTFPENDQSYVLIDGFKGGSMVKIIPEERKVIGYCRNNRGGVPDNFHNYFVLQFDTDFDITHTWNDTILQPNVNLAEDERVGAILGFKTKRGQQVNAKVASSFISHEQAQLNLDREIGQRTFDEIKASAQSKWNEELGRVSVKTDNTDYMRTFYSTLYRVLLFPRTFYEVNKDEAIVHYSPYNGEVLSGYMFTDNGFWDTFRAVFPYFTLMYPEQNVNLQLNSDKLV